MKLLSPYKPLFYQNPKTRYYFITGGRGSAKSFHVSLFLVNLIFEPHHVILFTRWTMVSAHISIIPEFIEKIEMLRINHLFTITQSEIIHNQSGSRIIFKGIKTSQGTATANLKSIQGVTTFVLDEGEEMHDEDSFDRIDLSIRSVATPNRVIVVMNPSNREHMLFKKFTPEQPREDVTYIHTTYLDNIQNLSDSFIEQAERTKEVNPSRYEHIFLGSWIDSAEGLLWNRELINQARRDPKDLNRSHLTRVILAIDPAVTATAKSDETGMVVVGLDRDHRVYVLDDVSGVYSPSEWASIAVATAQEWDIDAYVAEGNQGHDLVESNLRSLDSRRRVKMVRATRGKAVRAEPVYGLYERGLVHHVGYFPKLETQMVSWNPTEQVDSPDRVDALVWGVTELIFAESLPGQASMKGVSKHKNKRL